MKASAIFWILTSAMLTAESVNALRCYYCDFCPTVSMDTPTKSCDVVEVVVGVPIPLLCVTIHVVKGVTTGVFRRCAPNLFAGCLNRKSRSNKSKWCYCSQDFCNREAVPELPEFPAPPGLRDESQVHLTAGPLECYYCSDCPTVSSSTKTMKCERTQLLGEIETPLKCATAKFYKPDLGVSRMCAPSLVDDCTDVDGGGEKFTVCYCSENFCNSKNFDTVEYSNKLLPEDLTEEKKTEHQRGEL